MVTLTNLFKIIEEKGLTKSKVAKDTGISSGNISDWQNGRSMPTAIKLDVLANYLGVSVDYLLGRTDAPDSSVNGNSIKTGDINGDNNANMNINPKKLDKETIELAEMIEKLSLVERSKVVLFIDEMKNKEA